MSHLATDAMPASTRSGWPRARQPTAAPRRGAAPRVSLASTAFGVRTCAELTELATLHRDELAADWECVITGTPPDPIEPLP